MNWNNFGQSIWSLISAVGGVSVIIIGLSVWIGNIFANKLNEKSRLASELQIKLLEFEYNKKLDEQKQSIQFEYDKKLDEHKQKLQFEFDSQRQTRQIAANQNMKFLEKQFDSYIVLWDNLQDLKVTAEKLWEEVSLENLIIMNDSLQKTRLVAEKISLVMDSRNYEMLNDMLNQFERFRVGKRSLVELRTGSSIKLAYKEEYRNYEIKEIESQIRDQVHYNNFYRDNYQYLMRNIRDELSMKLMGTPLSDNIRLIPEQRR